MQIDKIMIVTSPVHLWKLLRAKEEIVDQSSDDVFSILNLFMDYVDSYVNGCKCDEEESYAAVTAQYGVLTNRDDLVEHLVKGFECDRIEFK